eukprot:467378_1
MWLNLHWMKLDACNIILCESARNARKYTRHRHPPKSSKSTTIRIIPSPHPQHHKQILNLNLNLKIPWINTLLCRRDWIKGEESDYVMDDPEASNDETMPSFHDLLGYNDDDDAAAQQDDLDEVTTYLALNFTQREKTLSKQNPLAWWCDADSRYGLWYLKRLTSWLYAIKGSSCPSEGMFSEYGNIVTAKTARLGEKKAEDTLFLHQQRKKKKQQK